METLERINQNLPKLKSFVSKRKREIDLVLLPSQYYCCKRMITIRDSHAKITLYDIDGILKARSYHGKCSICKTSFYYGLMEEKATGRRVFSEENYDILMLNTGIAFTKKLLSWMNDMICVGNISFEKGAEIYDCNALNSFTLNPDRLETAWFIYRILAFIKIFPSWPRKRISKEGTLQTGVFNG